MNFMSAREFIDTNVLVYADDGRHAVKQAAARELIARLMRERRGVLSLQVLQEFYSAATRKLAMPGETAKARIIHYIQFEVITLVPADVLAAIDLQRLHRWSFWDSLIVRAALKGTCARLNTEDMHSGQVIETVRIHNPFAVHQD